MQHLEDQINTEISEEQGDDILDSVAGGGNTQEWKWWIIRKNNALPTFWTFLTNMLTIYALFVTPFVLVFPNISHHLIDFELFVDSVFALDIILEFFKLEANQKESDFKQIRIHYIKTAFVFDCIAALPGLVTLEQSNSFNKLARFIHWDRFFLQLNEIIEGILMGGLGFTR